ncbi:gluconate 2-dehydrogenase subunit 3 family protein, partial [Acidobacteria bacterium AH-259-G07]|nr:gluconate 2-dehydrogenase subunit 3 family protein [Acidobacteria bacterium AH-259-G07]
GRSILGTAAAAISSLLPGGATAHPAPEPRKFPGDYNASKELARPDWKPVFLSDHQNETLVVLSDLIIPETDTPGAKAALVNRFIDRLLAADAREIQREFLESLAFIDGECRKRYGEAFVYLSKESQIEFLTLMAYPHRMMTWKNNRPEFTGHTHFTRLKDWIARAYYRSEIGMKELGWDGSAFHGSFQGCTHPEGSHK